jgi:hypothetical protein
MCQKWSPIGGCRDDLTAVVSYCDDGIKWGRIEVRWWMKRLSGVFREMGDYLHKFTTLSLSDFINPLVYLRLDFFILRQSL